MANTLPTPFDSPLSETTFATSCSGRSNNVPGPSSALHRHPSDGAVGDAGRDDARQRDAVAEELGCEAVVGLAVHLLRWADLGEAPFAHHRDLVGDRQRLFLVVGHQQRW